MTINTTITVPAGMSYVNAFHALWKNSKPATYFSINNISDEPQASTVSTAEKVAELFKNKTYFDYEGGRMLKTNFSNFPQLAIRLYDRDFGIGAAKKALEEYNKIPSSERFDQNDSYEFKDLIPKS